MKKLLILLVLCLLTLNVVAAEKHPRVAELEDKFKKDANNYLEARFPGLPFAVSVSIDPLRRALDNKYTPKGEVLPFYALDEETIQDEWDDPTATLYTLSNRVKRIHITIQVPSSLGSEELAEVKISLAQVLRLIPARDEIEVVQRKWTLIPNLHIYAIGTAGTIVFLLIGLFVIAFLSTRNISSALENVQAILKTNSSSKGPIPAPLSTSVTKGEESDLSSKNVNLSDPIKVREVIRLRIGDLIENKDLLRLENMRLLDEFGKQDPHSLGALLVLFPMEAQKELFAYSRGIHWLEAFSQAGVLTMRSLEIVEELGVVKPIAFRPIWEKLLIQIWRMDEEAVPFLKSMDAKQALSLLGAMPKFISLPLARKVFPGNWGALLDPKSQFEEISDSACESLYEKSLKLKELNAPQTLDVYKKDMELLKFVEQVDIRTEQEVYEAAPKGSLVTQIRPPFYIIFRQPSEVISEILNRFEISDWALAFFNVPKEIRKEFETSMSDKERFYYYEVLQSFDKANPSMSDVSQVRNHIAKTLHEYLLQSKIGESRDDNVDQNSKSVA
ncbi:MAG: hypothetical protein KDD61_16540 [Bdellovibrionales bacterium]|nr:hypothetical protein [Bdellovibrionales bacterium]